jgi:hypothetical protein
VAEVEAGIDCKLLTDPDDVLDRWPLVQRYRPAGTWEEGRSGLSGLRVSVFEVLP